MTELIDLQLLKQFFPEELLDYFEIVSFKLNKGEGEVKDFWQIDFEEKNLIPEGYESGEYESKGFMEGTRIQDFPLRGKAVFLNIRKRRWRHKTTGTIIRRDFTFISEGAKFTKELSDFLKGTGRYTP